MAVITHIVLVSLLALATSGHVHLHELKNPPRRHAFDPHLVIPVYRDRPLGEALINPLRLIFDHIYRENPYVQDLLAIHRHFYPTDDYNRPIDDGISINELLYPVDYSHLNSLRDVSKLPDVVDKEHIIQDKVVQEEEKKGEEESEQKQQVTYDLDVRSNFA